MSRQLVTGANGYLGAWVVTRLLQRGESVRAVVRSPDREADLRAAVRRGGAEDEVLEVVVADLVGDRGWDAAMSGVNGVHHVASPMIDTRDPDQVVVPARRGTLNVLRAARDAGVRRVVLTSSFAAVGYSPKAVRDYDESDWTEADMPGLAPYPRSKTVAERAAWEFVKDGVMELVTLNPTLILGPTLVAQDRSSLSLVKTMLDGSTTAVPRQRFGLVDVRDVAEAHVVAMDTPGASGRYLLLADGPTLTYLQVARTLRDRLGDAGRLVPTQEMPGEEPAPLTIRNERAKDELGFRPRPFEETIVETAQSLRALGLVDISSASPTS